MVSVAPPLSVAWGYGIILGLGALFALGMVLITWVLKRYNNELQTSEMFSTAGRTVKSGLVASAVVSSWTWAATLLQSTSIAYDYGVSGPFWYASGATVQIILFASIAIELKRRAPNAHVSLPATMTIKSCKSIANFCLSDILGGYQGKIWQGDSHGLYHLWPYDQYPGHSNAAHWWICCFYSLDGHSYSRGLLSTATGSNHLHHVWRHQSHLPDGLCAYRYAPDHHHYLLPHDLRHIKYPWVSKGRF